MLNSFLEKLQTDTKNVIKLGLDNITQAAKILNLNKPAPYIVTIAGTNGKGSVINLLNNLLVNLGLNVGCYTSPHLIKFNERIKINLENISDQELLTSFEFINEILEQNQLAITFFEFITLTAWWIFSSKNLDIVLLEIGLGGRLDAVNAIEKDLAIITSIDFDHQNYLGNTLESIGGEKAGIISENKPVILGDANIPAIVFEMAKAKKANVYQYGVDYDLNYFNFDSNFDSNLNGYTKTNIRPNNIATSLKALEIIKNNLDKLFHPGHLCHRQLCHLGLEPGSILNNTIKNFNLIGRCSWLNLGQDNNKILLDVAHNPQSINNLKNHLVKNPNISNKKIIAVFGMLEDKDIAQCIKIINPIIHHWFLVSINEPRGVKAQQLADLFKKIDSRINYSCFDDIITCYKSATNFITQKDNKDSILVVFGSFHVVGPVCEYNKLNI